MSVPRTRRGPARRENDAVTDAERTHMDQSDLIGAVRDELAQVRTELALLRRTIEHALFDGGRSHEPRIAPPPFESPESHGATAQSLHPSTPDVVKHADAPMDPVAYARLVTRIRSLVRTVVPFNAVVAVVSRGDESLVDLDGRIAWHFPRLDDGRWLGYHPRDSKEAIAHLERMRRQGARYLLFPSTSMWWLSHYDEFARHLESTSTPVRHDDDCTIYALQPQETR